MLDAEVVQIRVAGKNNPRLGRRMNDGSWT